MAVCYRMTAVSSLLQVGLLLLLLGRNSGRPSEKCTSGTACQPTRPPVVLSKCFKLSRFCFTTLVTYQLYNFTSLDLYTFRRQQRKPLRSSSSFIFLCFFNLFYFARRCIRSAVKAGFFSSLLSVTKNWFTRQTNSNFYLFSELFPFDLTPNLRLKIDLCGWLVFIKSAFRKPFRIYLSFRKGTFGHFVHHWQS